jgi:hypothetical protein
MTTPTRPPDDDFSRDPAFDDAWRALSREEPSAALDAAVRAAARREIRAGPQAAARGDARPRRSMPMNWWQPLAVAATLGAIAVGLLQLVTPERIGAPGRDGGVVSDMPATSAARQAESAKKQAAAAASNEVVPPEEKARAMSAPAASAGGGGDRKEAQTQSAAPPAQPAPFDDFKQQDERKDAASERKRDAGPPAAFAPAPPATPAAKRLEPAGAPAANVAPMRAAEEAASPTAAGGAPTHSAEPLRSPPSKVAPSRVAEPFPAERAISKEATTKREAASDAVSGHAPAAAGAIAPSAPEPPSDKAQAPKPAANDRVSALAKLKTAPEQSAGDRGAAVTDSAQLRREQDAQASTQGKSAMHAVAPAGTVDARVTEHPELTVPDWIALIRRLIAEKNYIAADKELAAFRTAHPDAQRLLPPDLRDWKTPR